MATYYFIYVNTESGKNPSDAIERALAGDEWARLRGGDLYLVHSNKQPSELRALIQPLLGDKGHILVGEFNFGNHSGWLSQNTVDWLNKTKSGGPVGSYYVNNNAQPNGDHEVHVQGCTFFPANVHYLGEFFHCAPAVAKASQTHFRANGCYWCCRSCHTS